MAYLQEHSYGVVPAHREGSTWRFLLVQHATRRERAPKEERAGHWAFPKGHPEDKEAPIDTARRELAEEAGILDAHIEEQPTFEERYFFTFEGSTVRKTVTYFLGIVTDTTVRIQEDEIVDYRWATLEEALELATFENARAILRQAQEYLLALDDRNTL